MRINALKLESYRNYQNLALNLDPAENITHIIGQNAQGKTNILEAIYLLSLTKSFRTSQSTDLVKWGDGFARVIGSFETKEDTFELEVFIGNPPPSQKSFKEKWS